MTEPDEPTPLRAVPPPDPMAAMLADLEGRCRVDDQVGCKTEPELVSREKEGVMPNNEPRLAPYVLLVRDEDDLDCALRVEDRKITKGRAWGDVVTDLWRDMVEQIGDVFPTSHLADRLRAIGELGPDKWGEDDV